MAVLCYNKLMDIIDNADELIKNFNIYFYYTLSLKEQKQVIKQLKRLHRHSKHIEGEQIYGRTY